MRDFGTVTFNGQVFTLTQDAYADNYGSDGETRYYASAVDTDENDVKVSWTTTAAWDNSEKIFNLNQKLEELTSNLSDEDHAERWIAEVKEEIEELEALETCDSEDESNACDWDNPISVE